MTRLLFGQNDSSMRGLFWHKDSVITHIFFELQPIMIFSPVANFGHHPLQAAAYNGTCKVYDANEDIQNQEFESQNELPNLRNWRIGILVMEKQMA